MYICIKFYLFALKVKSKMINFLYYNLAEKKRPITDYANGFRLLVIGEY